MYGVALVSGMQHTIKFHYYKNLACEVTLVSTCSIYMELH